MRTRNKYKWVIVRVKDGVREYFADNKEKTWLKSFLEHDERLEPMTGYIDRLTPGIFEKFGIKKLIFRVGDGYKLAKPGESAK